MKMYRNEKTQSLQKMILFIEIFANVKCVSFFTFIRACKLLNETEKDEKVLKHSIPVSSILLKISMI